MFIFSLLIDTTISNEQIIYRCSILLYEEFSKKKREQTNTSLYNTPKIVNIYCFIKYNIIEKNSQC